MLNFSQQALTELAPKQRTTSIVALNAVSTFAQIGQFGLGATLLPIALEARHVSPTIIGATSAAYWLGMLFGLLVAGKLTRQFGYRSTVIFGLIISALSFLSMPLMDWHWWSLPAAVVGFGLGLRWIANETWLYRLAPEDARGRIVGIHETLICTASFIGPLIVAGFGAVQPTAFWIAAASSFVAIIPIYFAFQLPAVSKASASEQTKSNANNFFKSIVALISTIGVGAMIAGIGGWLEGSLLALLPVYGSSVGLSITNAALLLTDMGVGAMVFQFPIGWLADHKGVLWTARLGASIAAMDVIFALSFGSTFYTLAIVAFFLGGLTSGFLTLGMIWAAQHGVGAALTNKLRQVSIVYTALSAAGPFVAGFVVSHTSSQSLFWQQLVVIFVLAIVLIKHKE